MQQRLAHRAQKQPADAAAPPRPHHHQLRPARLLHQGTGGPITGHQPSDRDVRVLLRPPGQPLRQDLTFVGFRDVPVDQGRHRRVDHHVEPGVHRHQRDAAQRRCLERERHGPLARGPSTPTTTASDRTMRSGSGPRTTTIGHAAWAASVTATGPISRPAKPPRPRSPSTTSSARVDSACSTATGDPVVSTCSTDRSRATAVAAAAAVASRPSTTSRNTAPGGRPGPGSPLGCRTARCGRRPAAGVDAADRLGRGPTHRVQGALRTVHSCHHGPRPVIRSHVDLLPAGAW